MTKRAGIRQKAGRVTNEDGYKVARVSEKHWPTTVGMGEGDIALINKAVEERWPVPQPRREPHVTMLLDLALDDDAKSDTKIQAARTVLTMEAQNQKDEHLIYQHENAQPQLHVHGTIDPEQCRARILAAIDAEVERRKLPPGDGSSDNGDSSRHHGNGAGPPKAS